jgi:hypothetical protein
MTRPKKVRWIDWYREFMDLAHRAGLPPEEYEGSAGHGDEYVAAMFRDGTSPQEAIEFVKDRQQRRARGRSTTVRARNQQHLPGIEPGVGPIEVVIPTMGWEQIGGDMDPGTYGGTIATADGDHIELIKIQPVREYVGDEEAKDVGHPFWTRTAWFDADDLDIRKSKDIQSALDSIGMSLETLEEDFTPEQRAVVIAEALLDYGRADEGPAGWSDDIGIPTHVKWSSGEVAGSEYLANEDEAFRYDVLGYGEIKAALEEEVERLADQSAAEGWSTAGDQMMSDVEDAGFDPGSIVILAEFGDTAAVNGDVSDETVSGLETKLEAEGYEYLDRFGGRVPSDENFAHADTAIERVAEELDRPEEDVKAAAESLDWWQKEIPHGTSGHTYVWAKKKAGVEERRRRHPMARAPNYAEVLTFEFPNASAAHDFFESYSGVARIAHRVVETECQNARERASARETAKQFGGVEVKEAHAPKRSTVRPPRSR